MRMHKKDSGKWVFAISTSPVGGTRLRIRGDGVIYARYSASLLTMHLSAPEGRLVWPHFINTTGHGGNLIMGIGGSVTYTGDLTQMMRCLARFTPHGGLGMATSWNKGEGWRI